MKQARRWMFVFLACVAGVQIAYADEPSPVVSATITVAGAEPIVNAPTKAWTWFKAGVNTLEPAYETIYDFNKGEWFQGVSGAVSKLKYNKLYLGSWRLGYAVDFKPYTGVQIRVPELVQAVVPASWLQTLGVGPIDDIAALLGKYSSVTGVGGYDFDTHDVIVGVGFGLTGRF